MRIPHYSRFQDHTPHRKLQRRWPLALHNHNSRFHSPQSQQLCDLLPLQVKISLRHSLQLRLVRVSNMEIVLLRYKDILYLAHIHILHTQQGSAPVDVEKLFHYQTTQPVMSPPPGTIAPASAVVAGVDDGSKKQKVCGLSRFNCILLSVIMLLCVAALWEVY